MTEKAQYQRVATLIDRLGPIWQERVGLNHFDIEHVYLDTFEGTATPDDFQITACAEARWNYQQAKIKWYLPSAVRHSDEALERTLVHELCHVLLAPEQQLVDAKLDRIVREQQMDGGEYDDLQSVYYDLLELATENATRAIVAGWDIARQFAE